MRDPTFLYASGPAILAYHGVRKWFALGVQVIWPMSFVTNAPFGRFAPQNQNSIFILDGIKTWIIMELPSPISFIYTFLASPLSAVTPPLSSLAKPHAVLALAYVVHYLNRAIISPLRTPSRSTSHLLVATMAIIFNIFNGSLMGTYLSSPFARVYLAETRPSFYVGLAIWGLGFVGNIYHDEILLNIRRKANSKGKGKGTGEHYAIPTGGLYSLISYPNYFCEWVEWLGFAIAAAPFPLALANLSVSSVAAILLDPKTYLAIITIPASQWAPSLTPPWLFFINSVLLMLPRAYNGHLWYKGKFGDTYPKERKAVIPFVL